MVKKKVPLRQCIGCGEMKPKKELVRIIKTPEGEIIADVTGKQNGRGAYICNDRGCVEKAQKSRAIERALKMPVPKEIYESLMKGVDAP
ncbi:MAG: YlxR family protein [Clostridiales bacterium]|nr:YlxR family protein [Clostridiales bacterium]